MRITHLRLTNFAPIYYSLDTTEVVLDYPNHKVINIFIGKMGSCKTFILGHHQPFATLGSLDARNMDDMILPGKRGAKEWYAEDGNNKFEILHLWVPSGEKHTLKSHFKKNGVELNPNGNVNSFKTIVLTEFGLDQNFLKLFRIGTNVINFPDMGESERKNFIGSMLSETDIYAFLYRRISERARSINAQMTLLTNRIRSLTSKSEEEMERDCMNYEAKMQETQARYQRTLQEQYRLEGELKALLNGRTLESIQQEIELSRQRRDQAESQVQLIDEQLKGIEEIPEPEILRENMTKLQTQHDMRQTRILQLAGSLEEHQASKRKLSEQLAIMGSTEQMEALKQSYQEMTTQAKTYEKQLHGFVYEGTIGSIDGIVNECRIVNGLIVAVAQYSPDAIRELFDNPHKAKFVMEKQLNVLHRDRAKVNQEMANLKYIGTYLPNHMMVRPFNCPTPDCPFYQYHPIVEQRKKGTVVDKRWMELRNKLAAIDAKINYYDGFPELAAKIDHLSKTWIRVLDTVRPLGIILEDNLKDIVLNPTKRQWYDENRLQHIRELCCIREQYYELMQRMNRVKNELTVYEMTDRESIETELGMVSGLVEKEVAEMEELEAHNRRDEKELHTLTNQYETVLQKSALLQQKETYTRDANDLTVTITSETQRYRTGEKCESELHKVLNSLGTQREEFKATEAEFNRLNRALNDIAFTRTQYDQVKAQQELMRDVVESLSSKNGIPLAFVKFFLAECKDDINDLIHDVFADQIEVQQFNIPEDGSGFRIPYMKNGKIIDDVNKASQGERAIISLALAFALIRQNLAQYHQFFIYNIMLIDEMDAPLYKEDRNKFIMLLMKQLQAIHAEQVFLVSHNNTFDGFNVNIIMTTEEDVEESGLQTVIRVGKR